MTRRMRLALVPFCALALTVACAKSSTSPASPSGVSATGTAQGANGETLKVSAPTPQSPTGGGQVTSREITLVWSNSAGTYTDFSPTYRVQLMNAAGTMVYEVAAIGAGSNSATSHLITMDLDGEATYTWRVRAEYQGAFGPWSSVASFISPVLDGYIKGNELYDPLDNGKTVGTLHGDVAMIPGQGVHILSQAGYVSYELPQTLTEGEFSMLVTNLRTNTEGGKTKIMAMAEGYGDLVTNDRRMTVEKRGDPAGVVAWRFITHDDQTDTEGVVERRFVEFDPSHTYLFRVTWRNNLFRVEIIDGGVNGDRIYEFSKTFHGRPYDPVPHVIYLGAPEGRSGIAGASVDDVIIRQVWVSGNPRPSYANK